FFLSSRRRHTSFSRDWSSDVCSSDLRVAVIALVGCALLMRSLGPDEVRVPWNPYITVLPYLLLVFLTWAMIEGERWALPAAVARSEERRVGRECRSRWEGSE